LSLVPYPLLVLAATVTTTITMLPGQANRIRALAERIAAHLAHTANEIRAALERLAEKSHETCHYIRG